MNTNTSDQIASTSPELSEEVIVRRYARRFPGYRLANYDRVALPMFRMQVRILTIIRKKIPALQEFVLRSVDAGFTHAADIAGLLGLERTVVNRTLAELTGMDALYLGGAEGDRTHRLILTEQGKGTLNTLTLERAEEEVRSYILDGLTRSLVSDSELPLQKAVDVRKDGITEIAPYPRTRPEIEEFRDQMFREWNNRNGEFDLIAVLEIERVETLFRTDVLMLTFVPDEGIEDTVSGAQVGFVVGGHWGDLHADAFRKANADSRIPLIPERSNLRNTTLEGLLPSRLAEKACALGETRALLDQIASADESIRIIERQLQKKVAAAEQDSLTEQLMVEKTRLLDAQSRLDRLPVRHAEVYEHKLLLNDALTTAAVRLLIISPIGGEMDIDREFARQLELLLKRRVDVYIGYSIESFTEDKNSNRVLKHLQDLQRKYPTLFLHEIKKAHPKILACDSRFFLSTSFNWFSSGPQVWRGLRDGRGFYVSLKQEVNETFNQFLSLVQGYGP